MTLEPTRSEYRIIGWERNISTWVYIESLNRPVTERKLSGHGLALSKYLCRFVAGFKRSPILRRCQF